MVDAELLGGDARDVLLCQVGEKQYARGITYFRRDPLQYIHSVNRTSMPLISLPPPSQPLYTLNPPSLHPCYMAGICFFES